MVGGDYDAFAAELVATGILSDPWIEGRPRFDPRPLVLPAAEWQRLGRAAEAVAAVYNEACKLCDADPALLDELGLSPAQRLMWASSAPMWHGIARADVFVTEPDGAVAICEINSDTPSGQAEAVLLGAAARRRRPELADPSAELEERLCGMLAHVTARATGRRGPLSVGILYPTEMTEDLSMILLYRQWFEARGWSTTLGAPFNLRRLPDGRVALFDRPCDLFLRHYKTDWWGEREPVWEDEAPYDDPEPLVEPLGVLLGGAVDGACAVVNPFGAVVPQNKRIMALMWEHLDRFPPWAQAAIRAHVPYSVRLETLPGERLLAEREDWVLKSDYGCESDEVVLGAQVTPELWAESVRKARPRRWIAQRRFVPRPDEDGRTTNHGVYLVAGQAAGLFCRADRGATDYTSVTRPGLVST